MKRHLCIDFDGVIHSYMTPWSGAHVISDPPVEGAIAWLTEMVNHENYIVNIYSSRSSQVGGIEAMIRWLDEYMDWEPGDINFPVTKPPAYLTIDDRAICFRGTFPSVRELDNFKPWFDKYKEVDK